MKLEWKSPELEVLDVKMTMAAPNPGTRLDASFNAGTTFPELTWS
ncbi:MULTISPECIES: paeninodin family lasso peptide [Niallia]|uniref:Paeninodin family lasso peptide n=2 Tax=Niallia TaxID=2837506 RepID=A0A3S2U9U2_9BACI|nr:MULTISPECIES: paeninodin family lasso peptide [Niallia]MCM3213479.1 paeninodin family lasso peptide [Niallia taxi]MDE5054140.1 paeninodin family lasso peptide [Niallia taxi]MED4036161.1 paeninodin family lasso peptide [Niallia taxi]RVT62479.1 paeninodin family lasso peptide [Niallia taxi]TRZ40601.1 paeninodin family lasso peptide [Niallia circulans]